MRVKAELRDDTIAVALGSEFDWWFVHQIKSVGGGRWKPKAEALKDAPKPGAWVFPYSPEVWEKLLKTFEDSLEGDEALIQRIREDAAKVEMGRQIKATGDGSVPGYMYATEPYAHQRMGHAFLNIHDYAGLLWEMGTGKTKTVIDDLLCRKLNGRLNGKVLVVCPNEVKRTQWARQIPLHSGGALTVQVLSGSTDKRKQRLRESSADVFVINYEGVLRLDKELVNFPWAAIILDEATRIKNARAKRTKILLKMKAPVKRILTGTPITQSPSDAFAPFTFLNPGIFGSWWNFHQRYLVKGGYGGYQVIGYRNLDELKNKIEQYSSRVLKDDVLDLPEKTYTNMEVELEGEGLEHYKRMRDELRTSWLESDDEEIESNASIILTQMLRLSQISGGLIQAYGVYRFIKEKNAKLAALQEIIDDLPKYEKIVVFAVYQHEIEALAAEFSALNPALIYGNTSPDERAEMIREFQDVCDNCGSAINARCHRDNPDYKPCCEKCAHEFSNCRMLIAQIHSGGIGIDLTAAQTAVYYTRNWSLEDFLQSQDRLHRIGQRGTVNIITLVGTVPNGEKNTEEWEAKGKASLSIDEAISMALVRKQAMADRITGDKERDGRAARKQLDLDVINAVLS